MAYSFKIELNLNQHTKDECVLKDILAKTIDHGRSLDAEYVEVRAQSLFKTLLTTKDGTVEGAKEGTENGAGVRALVNGAWGFVSLGKLEPKLLTKAVDEAVKLAKAASLHVKSPVKLAEVKAVQDKVVANSRKNPRDVSMEQKIENVLAMDKTAFGCDSRIRSCTINYLDVTGKSYFVNSDGSYIEQDKLYVWSRILASAKQDSIFASAREEIGSTAGYEVFDTETPEKVGTMVAKRAVEQLKAKTPKGGTFPAVIGPNVVGVFIHEAMGHLAEADLTLSGSVLYDKLGKQIASDVVTVYDDGTVEGAFGSFKYDDEGVRTQKTALIEKGTLTGLMHSRETAQKLDMQPTGNARAEDFRVEPIIRMRNTYLEAGDSSFEELIEDVDFGYYLKSFRGGQANLDGTFQVGIQEAYEIVKGKLGDAVRSASISGNTLETLRKVDAVGKDFELWSGRCGKGQTAFICDGGPHIRVGEVTIGGGA
ncbi:MAG: TldD/PmbA family protein [Candidatus Bathyarchaeum sp.]|nr:MAG: TldD/PmbA family protein [Candidatus Bathyarchaeum sp.]